MIIKHMKLDGFRKHEKEVEITFSSEETYIIGGNFKGKTTFVMAIIWCILGTNMRGNDKENVINRNRNECTVELDFTDNNGNNRTLVRHKERYGSNNNFVILDDKIVKQQDLLAFYNDAPLLLSIMNPDYFRDMEPMKQREIINSYLPNIQLDDVIKKLSKDEQAEIKIPHNNVKLYIKDAETEIKEMQDDIKNRKGKIDYAKEITSTANSLCHICKEKTIAVAGSDIQRMQTEIEMLEKEISKAKVKVNIAKKLYFMTIQEKMKIAKKYMPNVDIKFYEVVKTTGELKDCFKITRNGEEFYELSKSLKFVTMLELCSMLNHISGLKLPLIIDDSESYPDFTFNTKNYASQLIILQAVKGKELTISNSNKILQAAA